jgi:hypothetical protein
MKKRFVSLGEGVNVGMSAAVRFGDYVAVSGQVAMDEADQLIAKNDFAAQAEQCFANLARVLEQAGGCLADVGDADDLSRGPRVCVHLPCHPRTAFPNRSARHDDGNRPDAAP